MSAPVRRATLADAIQIAEIAGSVQALHAAALPSVFQAESRAAFPASQVADLLARPNHYFWVAPTGAAPAAYLYAEHQRRPATTVKIADERLYIHQMGVLSDARGRGLGSALLAAARDFAEAQAATQLVLDVWLFNRDAERFYERHGFVPMRQELWSPVDPERP